MKSLVLALLSLAALPACAENTVTPAAIWQVQTAGDNRNGIAKAVNFNMEEASGTQTALLLQCLDDRPSIQIQHGLIDDDDLTWTERGTKEYTTITYSIDGAAPITARVFLPGLDGSKLSLSVDNEGDLMNQLIAATQVSFNIAPATFDRPDTPVNISFNMTEASTEIGDTLTVCGVN